MRGRRIVAVVAVLGVAAFGCTSGTDDGALELDDATASPPEVETDPATEPPDEETEEPEDPSEGDEPLFPPLPPLEPDPDSDVPVEDQEFLLELHAEMYAAVQGAAADPTAPLGPLSDLLGGEAYEEVVATVEAWRSEDLLNLSPDTLIPWIRVADGTAGASVVEECRIYGPRTGLYRDGALVEPAPEGGYIVQTRYGLEERDGTVTTVGLEIGVVEGGDSCG